MMLYGKSMEDQLPRRSANLAAALFHPPATLAQAVESTTLTADIPAEPLAQALAAMGRGLGIAPGVCARQLDQQ